MRMGHGQPAAFKAAAAGMKVSFGTDIPSMVGGGMLPQLRLAAAAELNRINLAGGRRRRRGADAARHHREAHAGARHDRGRARARPRSRHRQPDAGQARRPDPGARRQPGHRAAVRSLRARAAAGRARATSRRSSWTGASASRTGAWWMPTPRRSSRGCRRARARWPPRRRTERRAGSRRGTRASIAARRRRDPHAVHADASSPDARSAPRRA